MKEIKKLKRKIANMALDYIEKHEGRNNQEQRKAKTDLQDIIVVYDKLTQYQELKECVVNVLEPEEKEITKFIRELQAHEANGKEVYVHSIIHEDNQDRVSLSLYHKGIGKH